MFTSDECRAIAEQKFAEAWRDGRHRRRLVTAANAWLLLADKLATEPTAAPSEESR